MTQIPQTISPLRQRMIDDMTLRHVMVWINLRIGTSVSSLEACPTPAL
jgi:hypothetical protein